MEVSPLAVVVNMLDKNRIERKLNLHIKKIKNSKNEKQFLKYYQKAFAYATEIEIQAIELSDWRLVKDLLEYKALIAANSGLFQTSYELVEDMIQICKRRNIPTGFCYFVKGMIGIKFCDQMKGRESLTIIEGKFTDIEECIFLAQRNGEDVRTITIELNRVMREFYC